MPFGQTKGTYFSTKSNDVNFILLPVYSFVGNIVVNKSKMKYQLHTKQSIILENESYGFSYGYITWYAYLELRFKTSNTESYCTDVRYSTVSSSKKSSNTEVRSLQ